MFPLVNNTCWTLYVPVKTWYYHVCQVIQEAKATGRMDYTLSDFHVVCCDANYTFGLSQPASVSSRCL